MVKRAIQSNSTSQQVKAVQDAQKVHDWPSEAGAKTDRIWRIYVKNQCYRAHDDWNVSDLLELARTSILQDTAAKETQKLRREGLVVDGRFGTRPNPRATALSTLNGSIVANLRRLGVTASNSGGDRSGKKKRAEAERRAGATMSDTPHIPELDTDTDGVTLM